MTEKADKSGDFFDQVALATGAGSGIGAATALAFASQGARVCCADVNLDAAEKTASQIIASGGNAIACGVDVADEQGNADMVARLTSELGDLSIAFLNAGVLSTGPLLEIDVNTWDRVMAVNLRSVFLGLRAVVPEMQKHGSGAITITASVAGLTGEADMSLYTASKHGVVGLAKCAAGEFAASNIRVNAVAPGAVATPMSTRDSADLEPGGVLANLHPMGRVAQPEEIADLVLFLSSPQASFITGGVYSVDGGIMAVNNSSYRG